VAFRLAAFRFDVTPPLGHPLLAGMIPPAAAIEQRLEAIGLVLLGDDLPIVVCAVDWCALANDAHAMWRAALADAARTAADRVLLHVVHQHNAPFVCPETARITAEQGLPANIDAQFFSSCLDRGRQAVEAALRSPEPLTGVGHSRAKVRRIASNRRFVGPDGKLSVWRPSSSTLRVHRTLPEGRIDPWLRTIAFYSGKRRLASLHFYATHPISYYGDGRVTGDFVGIARQRRQDANPACTQLYFTGCAGDIAAGKYNDGSARTRRRLATRLHRAMRWSEWRLRPQPLERLSLKTAQFLPDVRSTLDDAALRHRVADSSLPAQTRIFHAFELAFRARLGRSVPLPLASLQLNDTRILSLPAECFLEYQLRAQSIGSAEFVAVAAYGDGGPWYIPTAEAYPQGGYEIERAICAPGTDPALSACIAELLH